jgi:N,N'-diacetyllegionaminate synthase
VDGVVSPFRIGDRTIGPGHPCFIIAEAGVNHNGDPMLAKQLVDVAVAAGADAVKFQTFRADRLATMYAPKAGYQRRTTDPNESQYAMLKRLELTEAMHEMLVQYCQDRGIIFLSTPFDEESADYLAKLGVPAFKTPSGEITNHPYLRHLALKGLPMVVSTGMANLGEVDAAMRTIRSSGSPPVALLHCVSNYPADPSDANLRAMGTMARAFDAPVGWSDHTSGLEVSLAAVALGAAVIEKHYTTDRDLPGPDHEASLEPRELADLVQGIRKVEAALGNGVKEPTSSERGTAEAARKSIVAAHDLAAGAMLTPHDLVAKRPGTGLPPSLLPHIIGRRARVHIRGGTVVSLEMLE